MGSLAAWWILYHLVVPDIVFGANITKEPFPDAPSGYRYCVRLHNRGPRRVIDVRPIVRFRIKGILSNPNHWKNMDLAIDDTTCVSIPSRSFRDFFVFPERTTWFQTSLLPESVRNAARDNRLSLEELLELQHECYIQVYVFCYDSWSGARKLYSSKRYGRRHLTTV